jgi:hypothetical protein
MLKLYTFGKKKIFFKYELDICPTRSLFFKCVIRFKTTFSFGQSGIMVLRQAPTSE